ncbi:MAG: hypothetical protein C4K58_06835 [Flavobacteriaceae bacterium]|nr:MAG: hypothetical protein C4K58_06835 [Flavobacteriaceae bacterium]
MREVKFKINNENLDFLIETLGNFIPVHDNQVQTSFFLDIISGLVMKLSKKRLTKNLVSEEYKCTLKYFEAVILARVLAESREVSIEENNLYFANVCLILFNQINPQL